ncbi:Cytochrome P450 [Thermomonospora echinospora]|uniref:Cytochrome P450 n=1 Tax=Thermomonospora echinospora TaxID=1992 RepID=A0A1H6DTE0_9ACTN|nr:cytochrome P450 [Thermomonospora echinospora]SEG88023.1 Cytochrome P450 [Thermomonospora echinospora]
MTLDQADVPLVRLDPTGADHHGEVARLRAAGPVARVLLPGDIPAFAVTTHDLAVRVLQDRTLSKDWRHWTAAVDGRLADDNPMVGMVKVPPNMVVADGAEHQRLRRPVIQTFTHRRVQDLTGRIRQIVTTTLARLPDHADQSDVVDLRRDLAVEVPVQVICELLGVPGELRPRLRHLVDSIFRTDTTPQQVAATQAEIPHFLAELVAWRTREPGDDLTSAMIADRARGDSSLSEGELAGTLWVLLTAGHETTVGLIGNAVHALLAHPDQLALALAAEDPAVWKSVVEETLRWDPPITNFIGRYPRQDLDLDGVTVPAGEAILISYAAANRDPVQHGPDADRFDITRTPQAKHLAFGDGPHVCVGPHLARLEAEITLHQLFRDRPALKPAEDLATLPRIPSLFTRAWAVLPTRLGDVSS